MGERWSGVRTRADDAYHDVAQFHLHEFAADVTGVTDGRGLGGRDDG